MGFDNRVTLYRRKRGASKSGADLENKQTAALTMCNIPGRKVFLSGTTSSEHVLIYTTTMCLNT